MHEADEAERKKKLERLERDEEAWELERGKGDN